MVAKVNRLSLAIAPRILAVFQAVISFFEFFLVKPVRNAKQGVLRVGEIARAAGAGFIIGMLAAIFQFAADNVGLLSIPPDQAELIAKACFAVVTVLQIIMRLAQGSDDGPNDPSPPTAPIGPVVGA